MIKVKDVFLSIGYIDKHCQCEHSMPYQIYMASNLELQIDRQWHHVIEMVFKAKGASLAHPNLTAIISQEF
jgi:hypothetical protein